MRVNWEPEKNRQECHQVQSTNNFCAETKRQIAVIAKKLAVSKIKTTHWTSPA